MASVVRKTEKRSKLSARLLAQATVLALLTFNGAAVGQQDTQTRQRRVVTYPTMQIDMEVRAGSLQFVPADDGRRYLAYNLFVTNWGEDDLRFARVDVEDAASGRVLVSYDRAALEDPFRQRASRFVTGEATPGNRVLKAGRLAVFTIAVRLEAGASPPAAIRHRILFESEPGLRMIRDDGSFSQELVSVSAAARIDGRAPLILGAPVRGGPWRCGNGLGLRSDHNYIGASRTARLRVAQRFGCDFIKVDPQGNILPHRRGGHALGAIASGRTRSAPVWHERSRVR